jgi:hypothetical protein
MKKYGDYLIIGSGAIATAAMAALTQRGVCFSVSVENEDYLHRQELFCASTYIYFSGFGGLANYWHSVIDSHWFDRDKTDADLNLLKLFGIERIADINSEVIPLKPFRPKSLFKKFAPLHVFKASQRIVSSKNGVRVYFKDGENTLFKKVFICSGVLSNKDILVTSGLAKFSDTLSDHVIGYSEDLFYNISDSYIVRDRMKWAFARKYDLESNFKSTYRPIFSQRPPNPKNKSIYSASSIEIMKNIFSKASIPLIKEAISLRYGIRVSKPVSYRKFYQINIPNCYVKSQNKFIVNDKLIENTLNSTGENIQSGSLLSGIHFYNSLSRIDSDVLVRKSSREGKIFLFTSGYDFNPGPYHFTYYLMKNAYTSILESIVE